MPRLTRLHASWAEATAGAAPRTAGPRTVRSGPLRPSTSPSSTTTWRTSGGDGPRLDRPAAGRAPGRGPAAAAGHDQRAPVRRRPDARGAEGDGRSRAADAPAVRPRRAGG